MDFVMPYIYVSLGLTIFWRQPAYLCENSRNSLICEKDCTSKHGRLVIFRLLANQDSRGIWYYGI